MLNQNLLNSAQMIMANTAPAQFNITAQFISSVAGSQFSFYPLKIDTIVINRDYIGNFADVIDMTFNISLKDYALLQDQGQNLLCVLSITYADKYGKLVYTPAPIQTQYNVMINGSRDVRKAVPDIQHYTVPQTPISVRLIEKTVYNLRQTKINTVYQNMTPTQAVHAITSAFGISQIQMVPSDNTHQYDHIDIPSYQGIDEVYGYLHSKTGLYMKGSNHYLTNGVLYVYPPFETAPTYDKTATFYQVDTGNFEGNPVFHQLENKNLSIVVHTQPESHDLSIAGSENHGTGFLFTRASRMTDGFTTIDSKQGAKFTDQPALSVVLNAARTLVSSSNNLFHIKATDNPMPAASKIISQQCSMMNVQWMNADPFQMDPGHAISYNFDTNGVMSNKTGILERATYHITQKQKQGAQNLFGAVGDLVLRLSPNTTQTY